MWRLSLLIGRALVFRDHGRKKEKLKSSVMCSCQGSEERDTISGDNSEGVPPVPIPNTEVKPFSVDGTWLETARESRSLPDSNRESKCFPDIPQ